MTIKQLLFEAYRRNCMCGSDERRIPITKRWLGLGTEAAYRAVLCAGLMRFHDDEVPPKGCMGWLCLTPEGVFALIDLAEEFSKTLDLLNESASYANSFSSQFMLAGGITRV